MAGDPFADDPNQPGLEAVKFPYDFCLPIDPPPWPYTEGRLDLGVPVSGQRRL